MGEKKQSTRKRTQEQQEEVEGSLKKVKKDALDEGQPEKVSAQPIAAEMPTEQPNEHD